MSSFCFFCRNEATSKFGEYNGKGEKIEQNIFQKAHSKVQRELS